MTDQTERCAQPIIPPGGMKAQPCGGVRDISIHPEGAYRYEGGEIGAHIPHAFVPPPSAQANGHPNDRCKCGNIRAEHGPDGTRDSVHQFVLEVPAASRATGERSDLTRIYDQLLHIRSVVIANDHSAEDIGAGLNEVADDLLRAIRRVVEHPHLDDAMIERIARRVSGAVGHPSITPDWCEQIIRVAAKEPKNGR